MVWLSLDDLIKLRDYYNDILMGYPTDHPQYERIREAIIKYQERIDEINRNKGEEK
jgi:hypothetical protein